LLLAAPVDAEPVRAEAVDALPAVRDGGLFGALFESLVAQSMRTYAQSLHVEHLHWLKTKLGDQLLDAIVINTGPAAYRRPDGIGVVPAAMLIP
jgi:hypothetical protein